MGLKFINMLTKANSNGLSAPVEWLNKSGCKGCPLRSEWPRLSHPHMEATGSLNPKIYMLGEAPGETEDAEGEQFVGKAGEVLRFRIPENWLEHIRWDNVIRCHPPKNRNPTNEEIEHCRLHIQRDIEVTKPQAIFGFGNFPLSWPGTGISSGITSWAGKRIPVQIGNHVCWFYPMMHPSYVSRSRKFYPRNTSEYGSDIEFAFALHLKQAFEDVEEGLPEPRLHTIEKAKSDVEVVTDDLDSITSFLSDNISYEGLVGFDYETNGLRPYSEGSKILTVALSTNSRTISFPIDHSQSEWSAKQEMLLKEALKNFLMCSKAKKVSHNLAFELEWSGVCFGKETIRAGEWGDSLTQAYILDGRPGTHSLDHICLTLFGLHLKAISGLDRANLDKCNLEDVLRYNGIDAKYHRLVYAKQARELERQGLTKVYEEALRRVPTVVLTQIKGILVHQPAVESLLEKYEGKLADIRKQIFALREVKRFKRKPKENGSVDESEFNPSSTHDVLTVLRSLGLEVDNTNAAAIDKIDKPFCKLILAWRGASKTISTYIKPLLPGSPVLFGDKLHPLITTTSTRTWRTASKDPNSQNFPKHGEDREVRSQIRAPQGWKIVTFDYSGIQARNVAMESLDKVLVDAFWSDYDIHADWREQIIELYPEWIKEGKKVLRLDKALQKFYRQEAKNKFVFPSFFGATGKSVAGYLDIPERIGDKLHDLFYERFSGIHKWHEKVRKDYQKIGYVTGLSGFIRRAPVAHTELINTPIQGDESAIVCGAMNRLSEMRKNKFQASMEIHDDLTFVWPVKDIEKNSEVVAKEMTKLAYPWMRSVPIGIEQSIGNDWADLKETAKYTSIELWGHKRSGPRS